MVRRRARDDLADRRVRSRDLRQRRAGVGDGRGHPVRHAELAPARPDRALNVLSADQRPPGLITREKSRRATKARLRSIFATLEGGDTCSDDVCLAEGHSDYLLWVTTGLSPGILNEQVFHLLAMRLPSLSDPRSARDRLAAILAVPVFPALVGFHFMDRAAPVLKEQARPFDVLGR